MSTVNAALVVQKLAGRSMSEQELDDLMAAYRLQVDGARWRSEAGVHLTVSDSQLTIFPHPAPMGFQNEVASLLNHMGWTRVRVASGDAEWISAFYRYSGSLEVEGTEDEPSAAPPSASAIEEPQFADDFQPMHHEDDWEQHGMEFRAATDQSPIAEPVPPAAPAPASTAPSPASTAPAPSGASPCLESPLAYWDDMNGRIAVDACPSLAKAREGVREFLATQGIAMKDVSVEAGMRVRSGQLAHFAFIVEFGSSIDVPA